MMKDTLLDIATRLDQIQWAIRYGDLEDEEELEVFASDILDIAREIIALANNLEAKDDELCPEQ